MLARLQCISVEKGDISQPSPSFENLKFKRRTDVGDGSSALAKLLSKKGLNDTHTPCTDGMQDAPGANPKHATSLRVRFG
jgi:hypothetical protein